MAFFPNRCQYIKVNGTQCGCPALRRNKLCYFHNRHHEERVQLNADRARRRRNVTIDLPVLEDANSIQVSLMQIMRLIIAGQIDGKAAGLLLYALQTASTNLARTSFEPFLHDMVLDPDTVHQTPLRAYVWQDSDFATPQDDKANNNNNDELMRAQALAEAQRKARKKADLDRCAELEAARIADERRRADATRNQGRTYAAHPPQSPLHAPLHPRPRPASVPPRAST